MHPTKIIALNGPPRCGKDTAARHIRAFIRRRALRSLMSMGLTTTPFHLHEEINRMVRVWGMSYALKELTHEMHGLHGLGYDAFEDVKGLPQICFDHRTPREAYIYVSESVMKPAFGEDVFGRLFVSRMDAEAGIPGLIIVPDAGFASEWGPVIDRYGADNMLLVRVLAAGRGIDFSGDSRSYITLPGVETVVVSNDKAGEEGQAEFAETIERVVSQWLSTKATFGSAA